ncbi:MAG TPA: fatty acid desaturase [Abditibacteriaceae bacterium]|nr:fatty acid desaturase [Abditibacteriaceae bacterium]
MKTQTEQINESRRIQWYRTPLPKETLASLNAKSDAKGLAQSLGHLGILTTTAATTLYGAANGMWWLVAVALFLHGTAASFAINAVHELVHKCVFKTQWLNQFFVRIFAFPGWIHFEHFYNSHVRHHQFTLHPPDDLEVVLPLKVLTKNFFQYGFVNTNPLTIVSHIKSALRLMRGRFEGEWEKRLYPEDQPEKAKPVMRWARTLLIGHGLILIVSISFAVWLSPVWLLVPVLTSLTPLYGSWLFFLCNNTQHIGLQDNVADFRLSCRTFTVNPIVQFLYWHMNYHTEHHMYAAVPCYNLAKLHRAIKHDLPPCPNGLVATWKEIAAIQRKQNEDSTYQHVAPLPGPQVAQIPDANALSI